MSLPESDTEVRICMLCEKAPATREIFWTDTGKSLMVVCKACSVACGDQE